MNFEDSFEEKNLKKIISSIKDLASSFCSNSEEVRKEVTSMSGTYSSHTRAMTHIVTFVIYCYV